MQGNAPKRTSPPGPQCSACDAESAERWLRLVGLDALDGDPDCLRLLPAVRRHYVHVLAAA